MATLLLRLSAPLQSWGIDSKFNTRKTAREPSKSGVIGLLAAALGRKRDEDINDLCKLKFGVRIDQEGKLLKDYQIVHKNSSDSADVTYRWYLSDAVFLVGLESDDIEYLMMLEKAVHEPVYPLFLGKRSCPPTLPVSLGIRSYSLEEALEKEPWKIAEWRMENYKKTHENCSQIMLRMITEDLTGLAFQKDVPISFSPVHRQYGYRGFKEKYVGIDIPRDESRMFSGKPHDPMSELEG